MDETKSILFFLQTLHYRDDLEKSLFDNLSKTQADTILSQEDIRNIFDQKVHPELVNNVLIVLNNFGVLSEETTGYTVNKEQLQFFTRLVSVAKASRSYPWPSKRAKPFLYISPPNIITSELSGEIDDITNLLTSLVSSASTSINIVSPFTNKTGLNSILAPLKGCKNSPAISVYLTATSKDQEKIFRQITGLIPSRMNNNLHIYFCSTELVEEDYLPHAKLLITDSSKGYLGSANFTKQGLTSRFEVGVELDAEQSKSVNKLLKMLIDKGVFIEYQP